MVGLADPPTFPRWLKPIVEVIVGLLFVGGYLVIFIWGLTLGAKGHGSPNWPIKNDQVQILLSTLGGLAATLFTVALNLPTKDKLRLRAARTFGLVRPRAEWPQGFERSVLVVLGTTLVLLFPFMTLAGFIESLARPDKTPSFIVNFAGPGMGILVTAVTVWLTGLTRPPD